MSEQRQVSGWAGGLVLFAAVLMVVIGVCTALQGLVAVLEGEFYLVAPEYAYEIDATTWGWTHLLVGTVVAATGFVVSSGRVWARGIAVVLVLVNAITQFVFLPYYPFWSVLMIALDVAVIWALCVYAPRADRSS